MLFRRGRRSFWQRGRRECPHSPPLPPWWERGRYHGGIVRSPSGSDPTGAASKDHAANRGTMGWHAELRRPGEGRADRVTRSGTECVSSEATARPNLSLWNRLRTRSSSRSASPRSSAPRRSVAPPSSDPGPRDGSPVAGSRSVRVESRGNSISHTPTTPLPRSSLPPRPARARTPSPPTPRAASSSLG